MPYEDTLAIRLRVERARVKQTQKQVAEATDITTTNLCHYEAGKMTPTLQTLAKLADYYGCSIDYLVGRE